MSMRGVINSDMTFSASEAVEKEKAFIVTAEYHRVRKNNEEAGEIYQYWTCGFGTAFTHYDADIKIGSIAPQEIDGFRINELQDFGYAGGSDIFNDSYLEANRECILHINGKDYHLTADTGGTFSLNSGSLIGIKDKEQIKVTYTLL